MAFSGGGAKGIVHVGALKALEARPVTFVGLSGTSAGAIVATLAAAGFTADEIINPESGYTIIGALSELDPKLRRATDLFGPGGWWRIRLFRALLKQRISFGAALGISWCLLALLGFMFLYLSLPWFPLLFLIVWVSVGIVSWWIYRSIMGGLADVSRFRNALDRLLQQKIFPNEPARVVTMGDFGVEGRPSLKIVSANLSKHRLHLFSPERSPAVAAADAVAASICLPVIFSPWFIDDEPHIDGGIVSNLPAWSFDEERELDPEALTIAIEIEAPRQLKAGRYSWLLAAIRTALAGSAELNVRVSGPAEQLALPTRLDLLDFDITTAAAKQEVRDVAAAVGLRLDKRLFRLPEIYRNACQVAQAIAIDGLGLTPGSTGDDHRVRVAVGRLERGYSRSVRFSYSVGFEDDTDEAMLVPLEGSVAGAAWRERQSILELYPLDTERDLPGPANRYRRKSRWRGLVWVMCIPILDDQASTPRLLVHLDGNSPLAQDASTATALNDVEAAVRDFFSLVLHELKDLEGA
ncbi:MAG TPA: patatin-like phospholipase family protein [Stellaceae bacterium]|jgi:NTE family protein|nr:patatin-like phospholipase family protein [Stellaceae bacterium]